MKNLQLIINLPYTIHRRNYAKFQSVEDQLRCGRLSTSRADQNVEKVRQAVLADRHRTNDEICEITGVS